MSLAPQQLIAKKVKQVHRRLWLGTLLHCVLIGWTATFLAAGLYFLARTAVWGPGSDDEGWLVLAGAWVAGTLGGLLWAWLRAPGSLLAMLSLDEKFALQERVTTACSLSQRDAETPAGQALLEDVQRKVLSLDVATRFPLRLTLPQATMPVGALVLAVCALILAPQVNWGGSNRKLSQSSFTVNPSEVKLSMENLKKVAFEKEAELPVSKNTKELEDELDKLLKKDLDPKNEDQVRETIQAMRSLEEKMKERVGDLKTLKEKNKDFKNAMDQLDKLSKKLNKEGPARDFQDALAKGDMKKTMKELEKLQKQLENNELSKAEMKRLADQFQDLKDQLQRLHDQKDEKDELQKEFDAGNIDKEQLDRELERMKEQAENLEDLQELADLLGECQDCMGRGDGKGLRGKLARLAGKLREMDIDESELQRLLKEAEELEKARCAMLAACQGNCQGNGLAKSKNPGMQRPIGEEPNSKVSDHRQKAESDPQGKMRITGFTKGGVFNRIPSKEVGGAFQRADQESSAVLDRQRIPADAADIAKGYFNKLGGQK